MEELSTVPPKEGMIYDEKYDVYRYPENTEGSEIEFKEHGTSFRNYMRDIILGVNDGLISIYLLVAGVAGAESPVQAVLLAGIVGAIAGAISMMAGEYISTKSQEEVFDAVIKEEEMHFKYFRNHEVNELFDFFGELGLRGKLLQDVVEKIAEDDKKMMHVMQTMELGVAEMSRRNPWKAMMTVAVLFLAGSLPSVLPFFFVTDTLVGLYWATALTSLTLFGTGAMKTLMTKSNPIRAGFEHLVIGIIGGGVSYLIGILYGISVA
ncbi:MAG: hypothetical protein D6732_15955 [Methanobacteriota archaeon]|nr:MAG: hypothetical protein D6732_15955 [Euryarchaeota archaeon]